MIVVYYIGYEAENQDKTGAFAGKCREMGRISGQMLQNQAHHLSGGHKPCIPFVRQTDRHP